MNRRDGVARHSHLQGRDDGERSGLQKVERRKELTSAHTTVIRDLIWLMQTTTSSTVGSLERREREGDVRAI